MGLLLIGHWFPWPRRLPRLWAYAYGTASILAGVSLWFGLEMLWTLLAGVFIIAVSGGVAVVIAYQIDHIVWLVRMGWKANQMAERMLPDGDDE